MKKQIILALFLILLLFSGCGDPLIQDVNVIAEENMGVNLDIQDIEELEPVISDDLQIAGPYTVVRVVDGDTFVLDIDGIEEKVRLIGVDTPESVHPDEDRNIEYGKVASEFTKDQLLNQEVYLEYDVQERDKYGRILAYAYLDDKMYNKTLVEEGHAKVATFPPNVKYVDDFTALQAQARENKKGLWAYETVAPASVDYVGNSNSMKFHKSTCSSVDKISIGNLVFFEKRAEAVNGKYEPCKICNP